MNEDFVGSWERLGDLLDALGNDYGVDVVVGVASRRSADRGPVIVEVGIFDRDDGREEALLVVRFPVSGLSIGSAYEHLAAAALFGVAQIEANEQLWPEKLHRERAGRRPPRRRGGGR